MMAFIGFKNFKVIAFECCGLWFADQHDGYWSSFYLSHAAEWYLVEYAMMNLVMVT